MNLKILTIVAPIILLGACKKSESETKINNSIDPKLLSGEKQKSYVLSTAFSWFNTSPENKLEMVYEVDKDNIYTFYSNGTFLKQTGANKDSEWDVDVWSTWSLDNKDSRKIKLLSKLLACSCDDISRKHTDWYTITYLDSTTITMQYNNPASQFNPASINEYTFKVK
ncbi:MAG: hypothetical protein JHD28_10250 [Bacteroidia bacterium]|nr:hypothetical protein [Bacteroidia bacterium]